jgi:hypothetical protein
MKHAAGELRRAAIAVLLVLGIQVARPAEINFDSDAAGQLPGGWRAAITGEGEPSWQVAADASAPSPPPTNGTG